MKSFKLNVLVLLLVSSSFLVGCGTLGKSIKEPWARNLVGKKGYIQIRPEIVEVKEKGWLPGTELDVCEQVEIVDVVTSGFDGKALLFKQKENIFYVWSSRDYLRQYTAGDKAKFNYIQDTLPVKERTISFKEGKFKAKDMLCKMRIWTGMMQAELVFVRGFPESVNRTTGRGYSLEQWVYRRPGGNEFQKEYYYFHDGSLQSWQD